MVWDLKDIPAGLLDKNKDKLKEFMKPKEPATQKYKNKGTWYDGYYFRSRLEMNYYTSLKNLHRAKKIAGYSVQPEFILQEGKNGKRAITYKADFIIFNLDGTFEIIDTKGMETEQWKRTLKMFENKYPHLKIKIIKSKEEK